jgi:hypothetical protein
MRRILTVLWFGFASVIGVFAPLVGAFWWFFSGPSGSLDEAASVFNSHQTEIRQIVAIVQKDTSLGWVTPHSEAKYMTLDNGPLTARTQADYVAISQLLSDVPARDLAIRRDRESPYSLQLMRLVIFEPGWFGSPKPVMGVWLDPDKPLNQDEYDLKGCKSTEVPSWYVCPFDP